jgi:hypothetical protein
MRHRSWYNIGKSFFQNKEMSMAKTTTEDQLLLFQPPRERPQWGMLSPEIQQETIRLLTQMFQGHLSRSHHPLAEKEPNDE